MHTYTHPYTYIHPFFYVKADINAQDDEGCTPLHAAVESQVQSHTHTLHTHTHTLHTTHTHIHTHTSHTHITHTLHTYTSLTHNYYTHTTRRLVSRNYIFNDDLLKVDSELFEFSLYFLSIR